MSQLGPMPVFTEPDGSGPLWGGETESAHGAGLPLGDQILPSHSRSIRSRRVCVQRICWSWYGRSDGRCIHHREHSDLNGRNLPDATVRHWKRRGRVGDPLPSLSASERRTMAAPPMPRSGPVHSKGEEHQARSPGHGPRPEPVYPGSRARVTAFRVCRRRSRAKRMSGVRGGRSPRNRRDGCSFAIRMQERVRSSACRRARSRGPDRDDYLIQSGASAVRGSASRRAARGSRASRLWARRYRPCRVP